MNVYGELVKADLAFYLGTTMPFLLSMQQDVCYSRHKVVIWAYNCVMTYL